jgi:hypothetical protein
MDEVVEKRCGLTFAPGPTTTESCKLHYRNGVLEAAEILAATESTVRNLLGGAEAYLEVGGKLHAIKNPQITAFVSLTVPSWVR